MNRLLILITMIGLSNQAIAHDGHDHEHAPIKVSPGITYKPTAVPDRIVLTWESDPATSQAVTWRTDTTVKKAVAEIGIAEGGPGFRDKTNQFEATTQPYESNLSVAHYHSLNFTKLKPETKYVYRVGDGVNWSEWAHFTTASKTHKPFQFVYFGDAQNDIKSHWSRVVREAYQDAPRAAFLLHAGDLVNRAEEDAEWGEWFYSQGFIPRTTPCLAIPGNHEQAKFYDEMTGKTIRALSRHWEPTFAFPKNGPKGSQEAVYWLDYQGVRIIGLNSNEKTEEQAKWLEGVLSNNPQPWTVVTFHHPIYSSKAGRDNKQLRDLWQPIFDKYKVDLVLNGHDHTYARTKLMSHTSELNVATGVRAQSETSGTVYVVSVSGPKMYDLGRRPFMARAAEDTQLYQVITVDHHEIRYEARTATGRLYDAFTLKKRDGKPNELVDRIPETPEERRPSASEETTAIPKRKIDGVPLASPTVKLLNPAAVDQDDLCVWQNKKQPELSTIITSDKSANKLFVYSLKGKLLQSVDVPKPGNIDIRSGVTFRGKQHDIVAVNQRDKGFKLCVFRVDAETSELVRLDNSDIVTGPNYGGCLYHSAKTGRLFFFTTSEENNTNQFELIMTKTGTIAGKRIRTLKTGKSEGAVADDDTGFVYVAEEEKGIWKFAAEPDSASEGELIMKVGDNGIKGDLEGITLSQSDSTKYLTFSDQGTSTFHVLPLTGTSSTYRFGIEGVTSTDGIDVFVGALGQAFPYGLFACHSDDEPQCPILLTPIERVVSAVEAN